MTQIENNKRYEEDSDVRTSWCVPGCCNAVSTCFYIFSFFIFLEYFSIYFKNQKQDRRPQIPKNKVYLKYKQLRFKINIYQTRDIFQHLTKMSWTSPVWTCCCRHDKMGGCWQLLSNLTLGNTRSTRVWLYHAASVNAVRREIGTFCTNVPHFTHCERQFIQRVPRKFCFLTSSQDDPYL